MSDEIVLLAFFVMIIGGIIGLAGAALWWAASILFGFVGPHDEAWMACAVIGAVGLPVIGGISFAITEYRSGR